MFATACPGFHEFSIGPLLMTYFTDSSQVVLLAIFISTIRTTMSEFKDT